MQTGLQSSERWRKVIFIEHRNKVEFGCGNKLFGCGLGVWVWQ